MIMRSFLIVFRDLEGGSNKTEYNGCNSRTLSVPHVQCGTLEINGMPDYRIQKSMSGLEVQRHVSS